MIKNTEWIFPYIYLTLGLSIMYWKSIPLAPGLYSIIAIPVVIIKSTFLIYCIYGVNSADDKCPINILICLSLTLGILTDIRWKHPIFILEIPLHSYALYCAQYTTDRFTFAQMLNIPSTFALLFIHPLLFALF
jgi:hypothetical protein